MTYATSARDRPAAVPAQAAAAAWCTTTSSPAPRCARRRRWTSVPHAACPLEGPHVLWLVAAGAMDLFAVDAEAMGHWHFLGRLEPARCCSGPVEGPRHTLVGRPAAGLRAAPHPAARAVPRPEHARSQSGRTSTPASTTDPWGVPGLQQQLGPLEDAFARGVGRGLRVLFEARVDGRRRPGQPATAPTRTSCGCRWRRAACSTAPPTTRGAADLLIDGAMWQRMVNQQSRLLLALDRWIARLERAHEDRTAAGIEAGEAAQAGADQSAARLHRQVRQARTRHTRGPRPGPRRRHARRVPPGRPRGRDPAARDRSTPAPATNASHPSNASRPAPACAPASCAGRRLVEAGLRPAGGPPRGSGAPVALLWRRGRYEAVTTRPPANAAGRRRERRPRSRRRAVMFYRPLPDEPVRPRPVAALRPVRHHAGPAQPGARRPGRGGARRAGAGRHRPGARRVRAPRREQPHRAGLAGA